MTLVAHLLARLMRRLRITEADWWRQVHEPVNGYRLHYPGDSCPPR